MGTSTGARRSDRCGAKRSDWNVLTSIVEWEQQGRELRLPKSFRQIAGRVGDLERLRAPLERLSLDLETVPSELERLVQDLNSMCLRHLGNPTFIRFR